MNWVGGARSRVKVRDELTKQKEYFEKKRYQNKVRKLEKPESPSKHKLPVSTDLLSLQAANYSAKKFSTNDSSSPIARGKVTRVDLNQSRSSLVPFHRLDNIELPMSPGAPSKLLLQEASSCAKQDHSNSTKPIRVPSSHLNAKQKLVGRDHPSTFSERATSQQQQLAQVLLRSTTKQVTSPEKFQSQNIHASSARNQPENHPSSRAYSRATSQPDPQLSQVSYKSAAKLGTSPENFQAQNIYVNTARNPPENHPSSRAFTRATSQHPLSTSLRSATRQHDIFPERFCLSQSIHACSRNQSDNQLDNQPLLTQQLKRMTSTHNSFLKNERLRDTRCKVEKQSFDRASENLFFEFLPSVTSTVKQQPFFDEIDIEIVDNSSALGAIPSWLRSERTGHNMPFDEQESVYSPISYKSNISCAGSSQTTVNSHDEEELLAIVPQTNASSPVTSAISSWGAESMSSPDHFSSNNISLDIQMRTALTKDRGCTSLSSTAGEDTLYLSDSSLTTFRKFHRKRLNRLSAEATTDPTYTTISKCSPQVPRRLTMQQQDRVDLTCCEPPDFISPNQYKTEEEISATSLLADTSKAMNKSIGTCPDFHDTAEMSNIEGGSSVSINPSQDEDVVMIATVPCTKGSGKLEDTSEQTGLAKALKDALPVYEAKGSVNTPDEATTDWKSFIGGSTTDVQQVVTPKSEVSSQVSCDETGDQIQEITNQVLFEVMELDKKINQNLTGCGDEFENTGTWEMHGNQHKDPLEAFSESNHSQILNGHIIQTEKCAESRSTKEVDSDANHKQGIGKALSINSKQYAMNQSDFNRNKQDLHIRPEKKEESITLSDSITSGLDSQLFTNRIIQDTKLRVGTPKECHHFGQNEKSISDGKVTDHRLPLAAETSISSPSAPVKEADMRTQLLRRHDTDTSLNNNHVHPTKIGLADSNVDVLQRYNPNRESNMGARNFLHEGKACTESECKFVSLNTDFKGCDQCQKLQDKESKNSVEGKQFKADVGVQTNWKSREGYLLPDENGQKKLDVEEHGTQCNIHFVETGRMGINRARIAGGIINNREHMAYGPCDRNSYSNCCIS